MKFFDVLPNFPFTTSGETMGDYYLFTYKHGICELPHELPNDLRPRILRNEEISRSCLKFIE